MHAQPEHVHATYGKLNGRHVTIVILGMKLGLACWMLFTFFQAGPPQDFALDRAFLYFVFAGFLAQMIDGMLGMAYGVSCTTLLLSAGVPPAVASASVHTAEVFTTGVSGLSHLYLKNVDMRLFVRLAAPGIVGAVIGAYILAELVDGAWIKPFIAAYLLVLGVVILLRSMRKPAFREEVRRVIPLGFAGGLLDTIGGGGWGPVVATNIIRRGKTPQLTIGTVNTAEFFVAFAGAGTFIWLQGVEGWKTILGLVLGGMLAAPLGAILIRHIRPSVLMFLVGLCVVICSAYILFLSFKA